MDEIRELKRLLQEDRPVAWENLPDIDLYMDQVVGYLARQSVGGKEPSITSAMINNYVKDGLLPRACGKRYHREHLAYLTAVGLLKNVLTVKDMKLLLGSTVKEGEEEAFYGHLLKLTDDAFRGVDSSLAEDVTEEALAEAAMEFALASCAAKTACEQLLNVIRERNPEPEEKPKKEKESSKKQK